MGLVESKQRPREKDMPKIAGRKKQKWGKRYRYIFIFIHAHSIYSFAPTFMHCMNTIAS